MHEISINLYTSHDVASKIRDARYRWQIAQTCKIYLRENLVSRCWQNLERSICNIEFFRTSSSNRKLLFSSFSHSQSLYKIFHFEVNILSIFNCKLSFFRKKIDFCNINFFTIYSICKNLYFLR